MSYQPDQEVPAQTGYYPEAYQVEVINLSPNGFGQGFLFGCGFWLAAWCLTIVIMPFLGLLGYLMSLLLNRNSLF